MMHPAADQRGNSFANGNSAGNGNSTWNGGCIRPDCIFGLSRCNWHQQA